MSKSELPDPFEEARAGKGYGVYSDHGDPVAMLLRLRDVRKCAHNWETFRSGATPGHIVVPSEVNIRSTRQIPFEMDPPDHGVYREFLEPWFKRPLEPGYQQALAEIVSRELDAALAKESFETVHEFSLPLQSRALTTLLNVPIEEAESWIGWGTHVFRSEGNPLDAGKASVLEDYIDEQIDRAEAQPGDCLYSILLAAEINGKRLSKEEISGIIQLTFAGGRDTVINAITNTIAYLADHPESLERLRNEPEIRGKAIEELFRYFSPLTHMGRVASEDTEVSGCPVSAGKRVSLCWASANRDETVFENANEVVLDRKTNPHVAFGFSRHNCLGAAHARQVLSLLLEALTERVGSIEILEHEDNIEDWEEFQRKVGYHSLTVAMKSRN